MSVFSILQAGEGFRKGTIVSLTEGESFSEALLCEGHPENKATGNRIIPQDRGCTSDLKILKEEKGRDEEGGEAWRPEGLYMRPFKCEPRSQSCVGSHAGWL